MLKELLITIVLLLGFPVGYLLAYLCKEELVPGRKWFLVILVLSLTSGISFAFYNLAASLTCFFIFIVSLVSYYKSFDKKFVKN